MLSHSLALLSASNPIHFPLSNSPPIRSSPLSKNNPSSTLARYRRYATDPPTKQCHDSISPHLTLFFSPTAPFLLATTPIPAPRISPQLLPIHLFRISFLIYCTSPLLSSRPPFQTPPSTSYPPLPYLFFPPILLRPLLSQILFFPAPQSFLRPGLHSLSRLLPFTVKDQSFTRPIYF